MQRPGKVADHITSTVAGGTDHPSNLSDALRELNGRKGGR
jgi:hypothetical protein